MAAGLFMALAIGLSLGMLGGGGSTLTVPVLHYAFGLAAHDAIATSLVVVAATSLVAVIAHARRGTVDVRLGLVFGTASMMTAYVGGRLGAALPGDALIVAFAFVMVATGTAMLVRAMRQPKPRAPRMRLAPMAGLGLAVGLLTGVLGAGGGFLIVPALTIAGGLAMREAIGTSLLVIAMNATAALAGTAAHATIDVTVALVVTSLAIAGSIVGARLAGRLSGTTLQRAFGGFVIVLALFMLVHEMT